MRTGIIQENDVMCEKTGRNDQKGVERLRDAYWFVIQRANQLSKSSEMQSISAELAISKLDMLTETWHKFDKAQLSLLTTAADSEVGALNEQYGVVEDTY